MRAGETPVLAPGEQVVWQGAPSWWAIARDVYHLRALAVYLVFLAALDAYQSWSKAIPLVKALHDSVPLAVIIVAVLANFCALASFTARTTRYTITTRRVILDYGIAISATLSIPHRRVARLEVSVADDHSGDIVLTLEEGSHMPYLKLWPHARPWHVGRPQPMLRGVDKAAVVAALATRAIEFAVRTTPAVDTIDVAA